MFAALARWLQLRSAARRYARALGPQLRKDFGAGPFYTRQQIGKSAARAGLPMRLWRSATLASWTKRRSRRCGILK
jgi:hypothetical protein